MPQQILRWDGTCALPFQRRWLYRIFPLLHMNETVGPGFRPEHAGSPAAPSPTLSDRRSACPHRSGAGQRRAASSSPSLSPVFHRPPQASQSCVVYSPVNSEPGARFSDPKPDPFCVKPPWSGKATTSGFWPFQAPKGPESAVPQRMEKPPAAHNPEVGGLSPSPATKKPLKSYDFSGFLHFPSRFLVVYFPSFALNHVGTSSGALPLPPVSRLVPSSAPPFQMRPPAGFARMMRCSWTNLRQRREFGGCSAPSWH